MDFNVIKKGLHDNEAEDGKKAQKTREGQKITYPGDT